MSAVDTNVVVRLLTSDDARQAARAKAANVRVEDATAVFEALRWASSGMDFADALHLASRGDSAEFVTFDANFAKRAAASGASGVALLRG